MSPTQSATSSKTTTWKIDPAHTHVEFAVKHLMIATVRGRFSEVSGAVTVAGDDFSQARVEAAVGVASIDTREPHRDAHDPVRRLTDRAVHIGRRRDALVRREIRT